MKFAAIGDNCIDFYKDTGRFYPTGNAVDTAVNIKKLGVPTALISETGNDKYGEIMLASLEKENIDLSHFRVGNGPTAITYMKLNGKDRVHLEYVEGVLSDIVFTEQDIEFAGTFDLVHSALWGKADDVLPKIKSFGAKISFDYANKPNSPIVEKTLPFVDYGFFSFEQVDNLFVEKFLENKVSKGMSIAIATLGKKGAVAFDGKNFVWVDAPNVEVVNTVGAGDSFIAGFLYGVMHNLPILECLQKGTEIAGKVISVFEPWENALTNI